MHPQDFSVLVNHTYHEFESIDESLVVFYVFGFIVWLSFSVHHTTSLTSYMTKVLLS